MSIADVTVIDAPHRRATLAEVRAQRDGICRIAEQYGVSNVRVFGSVACGEADDDSDLGLLVDPDPNCSLFDLAGSALDVQNLVAVFTQVTTPNGIKARNRDHVLGEAAAL